jgi:hypothetical protein
MAVAKTRLVNRRDWTRDEVKELTKHSKAKTLAGHRRDPRIGRLRGDVDAKSGAHQRSS